MIFKFVLDFKVDDAVVGIYQQMKRNAFTSGEFGKVFNYSYAEALVELSEISKTRMRAGRKIEGILKIYTDDGILVGIAFPRFLLDAEAKRSGISIKEKYIRPGTIYTAEGFRGRGVAKTTLKHLINTYGSVYWAARGDNLSSNAVAIKCGMKLIKVFYFDCDLNRSEVPPENALFSLNVYTY